MGKLAPKRAKAGFDVRVTSMALHSGLACCPRTGSGSQAGCQTQELRQRKMGSQSGVSRFGM